MSHLEMINEKLKGLNDLIPVLKMKLESSVAMVKNEDDKNKIKEELERVFKKFDLKDNK